MQTISLDWSWVWGESVRNRRIAYYIRLHSVAYESLLLTLFWHRKKKAQHGNAQPRRTLMQRMNNNKKCTRLGISIESYIQMHLGHTYPSHTNSTANHILGSTSHSYTQTTQSHRYTHAYTTSNTFIDPSSFIRRRPPKKSTEIHTDARAHTMRRFFSTFFCVFRVYVVRAKLKWYDGAVWMWMCASVFDLTQFYLRNPNFC